MGPYCSTILQVAALFLLLLPSYSQGAETGNCLKCHKEYFDDEVKKTFIHKPFLEKECELCHSPDWVDNAAESDGKTRLPKKTRTLASDISLAKTHLFSIPKDYNLSVLFIVANKDSSEPYRVKLKVDPFESLNTLASDYTPPEIFDVEVLEVNIGAMASAKIEWHTDELSNSRVSFGIEQPDGQVLDSDEFLTDHMVELYSLKPGVTYYFKIKSEDIYGNSKESQVYTFSTDKNFGLKKDPDLNSSSKTLKLKSDVSRSEDNYLIKISANQHVSIEISTYDLPNNSKMLKDSSNLPQNHPPMKSIYETNVLICETCHQALSEKFSHPVHFRARLGSYIPSDYPRLPNGQMSCLTCHDFHASSNAYHLRKSGERKLCIGCHKRSFRNR
jgi:predicted CXXCH cytochrome family protein